MARDARGHEVRPGAAGASPAPKSRLGVSIAAIAAQFGFSVAEVEEYLAWGLDQTLARARGSQSPKDAEYTSSAFPEHVRRVLKDGHD